jgi:hypothetical protein
MSKAKGKIQKVSSIESHRFDFLLLNFDFAVSENRLPLQEQEGGIV